MAATISATDRLLEGNAGSPVRVLIYEDLQCPDCADFEKMLGDRILPRYGAKVAFEHRDFPLAKHHWARKAAIASRYFQSPSPEKALAWRRYAFAHQAEITPGNFNETLARFAKDQGLPGDAAVASLEDPKLNEAVEKDFADGTARGIAHTPTLLVNGTPFIEHFSFEEVAKAIDSELAAAK